MIMSIVTTSASLMGTQQILHEVPDPGDQVRPCPLSVGHPSYPKDPQYGRHSHESDCESSAHTFKVTHPPDENDRQDKRHTPSHQARTYNTPPTGTSNQTDQTDHRPKEAPGCTECEPPREDSDDTVDQYVRHDEDCPCSRANFKNTSSKSAFLNRSTMSCAVPSATMRPR